MAIYLRNMKDCVKVKVNLKKISVLVLGCSNKEIMASPALVCDILKTIGNHLSMPELQQVQDLGDVSMEKDDPDYVVKVSNGKIDFVDFI